MKILCNRKELANVMTVVQKAISNKTTLEILKCVKMEVSNNKLTLTGYDLELAIQHSIEVDTVTKEGEVAVNAKMFGDIIRKLPSDFVELEYEVDKGTLLISSETSKFTISALPTIDYPSLPKVKDESMHSLPQELLKRMIKETVFAVSQDQTKPILMGVLIEINEDDISLVAVDGYRLSVSKAPYKNELEKSNVIIPGKSLSDVSALLTNSNDSVVQMKFDESNALFSVNGTTVITRVLQGQFIEYKKLFPREHNTKIEVNTSELLKSIERASIVSQAEKNNLLKFNIRDNIMILNSNSSMGMSNESVAIELEGDFLDIAFNSRYLMDALKVINSEKIKIEFTTNVNPGIITPISKEDEDVQDYSYLLLPVRISSNI